ncbi:hypothetical protein JZU46_06105 [bacterium]|nr:hypothetical protein [bacterium]
MKKKKICRLTLDDKAKITKKVSRETFLHIDTLTKVTKDKTVYNRKTKHKKPKD